MADYEAYLKSIQTEYEKMQENYAAYTHKNPEDSEEKGWLRYLAEQMGYHYFRLDFESWLNDCLENKDWQGLCNLLIQEAKKELIPSPLGGYHHEYFVWTVLDTFAAGDTTIIERALPQDMGVLPHHNELMFKIVTHLVKTLWYGETELLEQAIAEAEAFLKRKTASGFDKSVVAFFVSLYQKDMKQASQSLLEVCRKYSRSKLYWTATKGFCTTALGMFFFAREYLKKHLGKQEQEALCSELQMPEYKNFPKEFASWRIEQEEQQTTPVWVPYFQYPEPVELLNRFYEIRPTKLLLRDGYTYAMEMQRQIVEEIWKNMEV